MGEKGWEPLHRDGVLETVTEEEVFELALGYRPVAGQRVASPFRPDRSPGCTFWRAPSGALLFVDHGSHAVVGGVRMHTMDCFAAVQARFGLHSYAHALDFAHQVLVLNSPVPRERAGRKAAPHVPERARISLKTRPFSPVDIRYWQRYGITREQLKADGVRSVAAYRIEKGRRATTRYVGRGLCFACTAFWDIHGRPTEGRAKLYMPLERMRFVSNCSPSDIGGLEAVDPGRPLVVTKSYKDHRVLRNEGLNAIWLQSEGPLPTAEAIDHLGRHCRRVTVLFDSDRAGTEAAEKVAREFSAFNPGCASALTPPPEWRERYGAKDPADIYRKMGRGHLVDFLRKNGLLPENKNEKPKTTASWQI